MTMHLSDITNFLQATTGLTPEYQGKIFGSIAVFGTFWVLEKIVIKLSTRKMTDPKTIYSWSKTIGYITYTIAFIVVARIWFSGIQSIATFLGLVSAGLAIALQTPITNIAGWGFIIWRKPFVVGDRIEIGTLKGDVIDQRLFVFTLMEIGNWINADQSTGRIIHIPNGKVFGEALANYSKGFEFIWNEIPVMVTFESDWEGAHEILDTIANKHSVHLSEKAEQNLRKVAQKMMIFYNKLTPIVYTSVADSGVVLTIRYLCGIRAKRGTAEAIWKDILREFAKHDNIDFAYPTTRYYENRTEGKRGTISKLDQEGIPTGIPASKP